MLLQAPAPPRRVERIESPRSWTGGLEAAWAHALESNEPVFAEVRVYTDDRGWSLMNQMQGVLDPTGQINYSLQYPGVIKAWHRHAKQTDFWLCLQGHLKAGIHADDGRTWMIVIGEKRPGILIIPPTLWHGPRPWAATPPACCTTSPSPLIRPPPTRSAARSTASPAFRGRSATDERPRQPRRRGRLADADPAHRGRRHAGAGVGQSADRPALPFRAVGRTDLDLARADTVAAAVTDEYRTVINCAAYTNVNQAEAEPAAAMAVNGTGVGSLAERCRRTGAVLVHYSTDYVFPGNPAPDYRPTDPCDPPNEYGLSKLAGERLIRGSGEPHLIVRTSWLYAPWGKNFVRTIAGLARTKPTLKVVNDQVGRPTSAEPLAEATLALLAAGAARHVSCLRFGPVHLVRVRSGDRRIRQPALPRGPLHDGGLPAPARRPAFSVMDLSATKALIGPAKTWQENLADVLIRMERD